MGAANCSQMCLAQTTVWARAAPLARRYCLEIFRSKSKRSSKSNDIMVRAKAQRRGGIFFLRAFAPLREGIEHTNDQQSPHHRRRRQRDAGYALSLLSLAGRRLRAGRSRAG